LSARSGQRSYRGRQAAFARLWHWHGATRWTAAPPLAMLLVAAPGTSFPASCGAVPSPGPLMRSITTSLFVHSMTGDLMLTRPLGGMLLGREARSGAKLLLLALLRGFFSVLVLMALIDDFVQAAVVGMRRSRFHFPHAVLLHPPHVGPRGPARAMVPRPRADPFLAPQPERRGQIAGARAASHTESIMRGPSLLHDDRRPTSATWSSLRRSSLEAHHPRILWLPCAGEARLSALLLIRVASWSRAQAWASSRRRRA
jgi:hypothetical protein